MATGTPLERWAHGPQPSPQQQQPRPRSTAGPGGGVGRSPAGGVNIPQGRSPSASRGVGAVSSHHVHEGFPGQRWRVLRSKAFSDVIARETEEVTSPEVRRIMPGEVVQQRGLSMELASGLVRMPIEPTGWVTLHARVMGGPTFLIEEGNARQAYGPNYRPEANLGAGGASGGGRGQGRQGETDDHMAAEGGRLYRGLADHEQKYSTKDTGPSYGRAELLSVHRAMSSMGMLDTEKASTDLCILHLPAVEAEHRSYRGERRERRERERAHIEERDEERNAPSGSRDSPLRERPLQAAAGPAAANRDEIPPPEKKDDCPTQ
eukprot:TRINITY_DN25467_c1_g1_i1.p1 TRINITY_DN25467_c1_g1~~TRINITY_DN25467_c1_g1_i1.p1  ORF type:complete len:357 (-),score=80.47 TRINITY_DN25467_c1_g1_i1:104-1063(-)